MKPRDAWWVAILASLILGVAHAQDIERGERIAEERCSNCHRIGVGEDNTSRIPTFAAIARMASTNQRSLAAFLTSPHAHMPDLVLSRPDIADVSAYILSLRGERTR